LYFVQSVKVEVAVLSALGLALIAVVVASLNGVLWKHIISNRGCPWAALIIFHILAVVILLPIIEVPCLFDLEPAIICFLLLSSTLWVVGDYCSANSYKHIDAAVVEVYSTLKLVFVSIAGVVLFSESLNIAAILGIGLIIASVIYQLDLKQMEWNRGASLCFIAVAFHTGALIVDKHLTELTSETTITFYGFLFPALIYITCGWRYFGNIRHCLRIGRGIFLISPVLGVLSYWCLLSALGKGDLSGTYVVQQTSVVFIFVFEVLLLGAYKDFFRKAVASVVCTAGAILVCGLGA
jgi:drug/metabolite transporter (DMT)-like permease